jgi:hypothetical protein
MTPFQVFGVPQEVASPLRSKTRPVPQSGQRGSGGKQSLGAGYDMVLRVPKYLLRNALRRDTISIAQFHSRGEAR